MTHPPLKILMAQFNPTVGAIEANAKKIIQIIQSHQNDHDLIVFPELAMTGYPPEDLLLRAEFLRRVQYELERIKQHIENCHVILGYPEEVEHQLFNTAGIFHQKHRIAIYHKQHLPNDGIFDEKRYFTPGSATPCIFSVNGYRLGLCICEDIWHPGPVEALIDHHVDIVLTINASPFDDTKQQRREQLVKDFTRQGITMVYVNLVGGQDELVFDGQSFVVDCLGHKCVSAPAFIESFETVLLQGKQVSGEISLPLNEDALIYQALTCGLHDYVKKNNFSGVILGVSGGIDSALVLALAVDALGAEHVHAVFMPSRYTASISEHGVKTQIHALNIKKYSKISIEPMFKSFLTALEPSFTGLPPNITEENLQARIRGTLLMALSNKTGDMVLATSNKSETAVGYATLYGDMCGGFAVLKDVYKTKVYALARYRNSITSVIPEEVINRAPTAELAYNQTDQDTLPDYALLDAILQHYMDENLDVQALEKLGYAQAVALKVIRLVKKNEYKRRQSAPGVKITQRAFGRDWRYPITSGFEGG